MATKAATANTPAVLDGAKTLENVLMVGDLSQLSPPERLSYYQAVCESVGLNPLTRPFDYLQLSGKLTLYAKRDATDQLRKIHKVSIQITARETVNDAYVVTARATDATGRTDESIGAVSIRGMSGDPLCNAMMKAETKAKRRVTLSLCGMGWLDETEIETIPGAARVQVDDSGAIGSTTERAAQAAAKTATQPAVRTISGNGTSTSDGDQDNPFADDDEAQQCAALRAACRQMAKDKGVPAGDFLEVIKSVNPSGQINKFTLAECQALREKMEAL